MLNFSRRASTLGWFFPPDSKKVLKIAHFCVSSHIGGVHGPWQPKSRILGLLGPHNNFFRKKSPYLNNLSLDPISRQQSVSLQNKIHLSSAKIVRLAVPKTCSFHIEKYPFFFYMMQNYQNFDLISKFQKNSAYLRGYCGKTKGGV